MEAHLRTCPTRLRVQWLQAQSYYKAGADAASHLPASQLCREVSPVGPWHSSSGCLRLNCTTLMDASDGITMWTVS